MPSRPVTRTLRSPRSEDRTAENPGTAAARSPATFRSAPLESHPDRAGDSPPRLDPVDRAGFCLVEYLERRPPGIEEHHTTAIVLPGSDLGEAQGISKKRSRSV